MRTPWFRDHPSFSRPRSGPLLGRQVLTVVAPTECDARSVQALERRLHPLGVHVAVTMECHGEARGEDKTLLFPDLLLVSVRPEDWDAVVFAGGRGAARVARDPLAREVAKRFAAAGRTVAAINDGQRVLAAAHLDGLVAPDGPALADELAARFGFHREKGRIGGQKVRPPKSPRLPVNQSD